MQSNLSLHIFFYLLAYEKGLTLYAYWLHIYGSNRYIGKCKVLSTMTTSKNRQGKCIQH